FATYIFSFSAITISFALIIGACCGAVYGKLGYFLPFLGLVAGSGLAFGGRPCRLLFSLPKALESAYDHRGEAARNSGYGAARESGLGKIDARYNAAQSKYERKYLPNDRDDQVRKRNSVFGLYIGGVMSFRHAHYPLGERRAGIFVLFQRFRLRKGALKKLACLNGLNKSLGPGHKFPSKVFACSSAGHPGTLSLRYEGCFLLDKTNAPPPAMRNFETDSPNKGPEQEKAARPMSFPLQNRSYLKYRAYRDLFQWSLSGSPGFLGGLPLPGTTFIDSKTSMEYRASLVRGEYPPRCIRPSIVLYLRPSKAAISEIVYPSIFFISAIISKNLKNVRHVLYLLHISIGNFEKKLKNICFNLYLYVIYYRLWPIIIYMSYFLGFLGALAATGASGLALGGLPLSGEFLIASKTSTEYTASFVSGC
ncbi:MAG: hypothetical protein LBR96_03930, partial [Treponema sp.]|nr:hypothetical protein [Treponema sp.]